MGAISTKFRTAFRRYNTDSVPGSGDHEPDKAEIFDAGDEVDAEVGALQSDVTALQDQVDDLLTPDSLALLAPDVARSIYVDLSGGGGGDGQPTNPFSVADALAEIASDSTRRSWEIIFKQSASSHYRGPPFRFDVSKYRNLTLRAEIGKNVDFYGSRFIASGSAAFTQPDSIGAPNVWMIDNKYNNLSGSVLGVANLIDLDGTTSQGIGLSGNTKAGLHLYTDIGDNQSLATMNSTAYRGSVSRQTTGTYLGKLLVHARASGNPNTYNFEQAIYDDAFLFFGTLGTDSNACRVHMSGIRASYCAGAGFWFDRCEVDLENCVSQFNFGYGFQLNESWGVARSCDALANAADGYNGNGTFPDSSTTDRNTRMLFQSCRSLGNTQMLVPLVGIQVVGDGFSNHNSQSWHCMDCYVFGATKDGFSMTDECKLSNPVAIDCAVAGVTFASQSSKAITCEIFGGRMYANTYGLQCNANDSNSPPVSATATMNVYGTVLDSNVTYSMFLTGNRPATINNYGATLISSTSSPPLPSAHEHNSNTSGSGVFNDYGGNVNGTWTFEGVNAVKNQNATTTLSVTNTDTTNSNSRGEFDIVGGTVQARFVAIAGNNFVTGTVSNHPYNIQVNAIDQIIMDGSTIAVQKTLTAPAATTSAAGFRLIAGTAPTSPVNGDMWQDGTNFKIRINGVTKTVTLT